MGVLEDLKAIQPEELQESITPGVGKTLDGKGPISPFLTDQSEEVDTTPLEQFLAKKPEGPNGPGIGKHITSGANALVRAGTTLPVGVADFLATAGTSMTGADVQQDLLYQAARTLEGGVKENFPSDQRIPEFETAVIEGLGQMGAQLGVAAATGGASTLAKGAQGLALLGIPGMSVTENLRDAVQSGASPEEVRSAGAVGGAAAGLSELLPLGRVLNILDKGAPGLKKKIVNTLAVAGIEAGQEALQQEIQNVWAKLTYDEQRDLTDGLAMSAGVGGTVGAITGLVASAVGGKRVSRPDAPTPEPAAPVDTPPSAPPTGEAPKKAAPNVKLTPAQARKESFFAAVREFGGYDQIPGDHPSIVGLTDNQLLKYMTEFDEIQENGGVPLKPKKKDYKEWLEEEVQKYETEEELRKAFEGKKPATIKGAVTVWKRHQKTLAEAPADEIVSPVTEMEGIEPLEEETSNGQVQQGEPTDASEEEQAKQEEVQEIIEEPTISEEEKARLLTEVNAKYEEPAPVVQPVEPPIIEEPVVQKAAPDLKEKAELAKQYKLGAITKDQFVTFNQDVAQAKADVPYKVVSTDGRFISIETPEGEIIKLGKAKLTDTRDLTRLGWEVTSSAAPVEPTPLRSNFIHSEGLPSFDSLEMAEEDYEVLPRGYVDLEQVQKAAEIRGEGYEAIKIGDKYRLARDIFYDEEPPVDMERLEKDIEELAPVAPTTENLKREVIKVSDFSKIGDSWIGPTGDGRSVAILKQEDNSYDAYLGTAAEIQSGSAELLGSFASLPKAKSAFKQGSEISERAPKLSVEEAIKRIREIHDEEMKIKEGAELDRLIQEQEADMLGEENLESWEELVEKEAMEEFDDEEGYLKDRDFGDTVKDVLTILGDERGAIDPKSNPEILAAKRRIVKDIKKLGGVVRKMEKVVWHGSPVAGITKFDISKVGTGQGAASYGWGFYVSDAKAVAKHYREELSETYKIMLPNESGNLVDIIPAIMLRFSGTARHLAVDKVVQAGSLDQAIANTKRQIEELKTYGDVDEQTRLPKYEEALKVIELWKADGAQLVEGSEGALYSLKLHPREDEYLLWDEPLKKSPLAKKAVIALMRAGYFDYIAEIENQLNDDYENWTGQEFHRALWKLAGESELPGAEGITDVKEAASKFLKSVGIKGNKYLDQASRGEGNGTYNYVIFDDADVKVTPHAEVKHAADKLHEAETLLERIKRFMKDEEGSMDPRVYANAFHEFVGAMRRLWRAIKDAAVAIRNWRLSNKEGNPYANYTDSEKRSMLGNAMNTMKKMTAAAKLDSKLVNSEMYRKMVETNRIVPLHDGKSWTMPVQMVSWISKDVPSLKPGVEKRAPHMFGNLQSPSWILNQLFMPWNNPGINLQEATMTFGTNTSNWMKWATAILRDIPDMHVASEQYWADKFAPLRKGVLSIHAHDKQLAALRKSLDDPTAPLNRGKKTRLKIEEMHQVNRRKRIFKQMLEIYHANIRDHLEKFPNSKIMLQAAGKLPIGVTITPQQMKIAEAVRQYFDLKKGQLKEVGIDTKDDPNFMTRIIPEILGDPDAHGFSQDSNVPAVLQFKHQSDMGELWIQDPHSILGYYIPVVERKLAYQPFLNRWNEPLSKLPADINQYITKWRDANLFSQPRNVWQKTLDYAIAFEYLRTVGFALSPGFKHMPKVIDTLALYDGVTNAKAMTGVMRVLTQAAEARLGLDNIKLTDPSGMEIVGKKKKEMVELALLRSYVRQGAMLNLIDDLPGMNTIMQSVRTLGSLPTRAVETTENGITIFATLLAAKSDGRYTAQQINDIIWETMLMANFRGGSDSPLWYKTYVGRTLGMLQQTRFKLQELRLNFVRGAVRGERDHFDTARSTQLFRFFFALGLLGTAVAAMFKDNIVGILIHPPAVGDGGTLDASPLVQLYMDMHEEGIAPGAAKHVLQWNMPTKISRMMNDDVPKHIYNGPFEYLIGLPKIGAKPGRYVRKSSGGSRTSRGSRSAR